ncbi:hypothetical protein PVAND_002504 [Polypedilum vanderplanki]|uniref:FLYWCH-type domain-containing protein n=1 Tax=Polypedilum vanderplanki TaxID=319348 RepID=A0A9J6BR71_POLVA|nr:hypothetical protein PVAND_002504 [Polypedilum vanderplanki]
MPKVEYIDDVDYAGGDYVIPQYKQSRQKNLQLLHNGYVYCRDSNRGLRVYWRCRRFRNGKCGARLITIQDKIINETNRIHTHEPEDNDKSIIEGDYMITNNDMKYVIYYEDEHIARYSQTTRGKTQLLYLNQPFIKEKDVKGPNNTVERIIWRCNQWWNEKCRARVYTSNDRITPLNKFHTHSHVINRKPQYEVIGVAATKFPIISSTSAVFVDKNDQTNVKNDPSMMPLHNGSKVYVKKSDILKIFCDKPALYSGRLATLIFGEKKLNYSCMPEERDSKYNPLNEEILESIINNIKGTFYPPPDKNIRYLTTPHGRFQLYYNGFLYNRNMSSQLKTYWRCTMNGKLKCSARIIGTPNGFTLSKPQHNHEPTTFISSASGQQLCSVKGKMYKKIRGRMYRSYYLCVDKNYLLVPLNSQLQRCGETQVIYQGVLYFRSSHYKDRIYWRCSSARAHECKARFQTKGDKILKPFLLHTHPVTAYSFIKKEEPM